MHILDNKKCLKNTSSIVIKSIINIIVKRIKYLFTYLCHLPFLLYSTYSLVNRTMPEAQMVREKVAQALRMWESNSKLTFREMYSDQADIQVLFARCVYRTGAGSGVP